MSQSLRATGVPVSGAGSHLPLRAVIAARTPHRISPHVAAGGR